MDKPAAKVKEPCMSTDNPDRAARLADALRTNLRRRKAQTREQAAPPVSPPEEPSPR